VFIGAKIEGTGGFVNLICPFDKINLRKFFTFLFDET